MNKKISNEKKYVNIRIFIHQIDMSISQRQWIIVTTSSLQDLAFGSA